MCKPVCDSLQDTNGAKPEAIATDLNELPPLGTTAVMMDMQYKTDWRKIVRLNCLERPGLSKKEFFSLFAKCNACKLVVACLVFHHHHCKPLGEDGLELTNCEE